MITLFKADETDFTHNGLGHLDKYIINPVIHERTNGIFEFTFKYPVFAPLGQDIQGQSIIRVNVPGSRDDQLFRVYRPVKQMGYLEVYCFHIFYDLLDNFIEDIFPSSTGQAAINQILSSTQYPHRFTGMSNISNTSRSRIVRKNPVEAILDEREDNSFINRWGGQIKRDNFKVIINRKIGSNKGKVIEYRKDLLGYEADVDYTEITTRIMPQGFDGLFLPEKYIDSPRINAYVDPKIKKIEYPDIKAIDESEDAHNSEDAIPLEDAYEELRRRARVEYEVNQIDKPKVNYKIDFVTLENTEEYKDLYELQETELGDIVRVKHVEEGFDIEAEVIDYKWDPVNRKYLSLEMGSFSDGLNRRHTNHVMRAMENRFNQIDERITITQTAAGGKNSVSYGELPPENPSLGDLFFQENGEETIIKQYMEIDGVRDWYIIMDSGEPERVKKEIEELIRTEIADLNQSIKDAQSRADAAMVEAGLKVDATEARSIAQARAQEAYDDAVKEAERLTGDVTSELELTIDKSIEEASRNTQLNIQTAYDDALTEAKRLDGLLKSSVESYADKKVTESAEEIKTEYVDIKLNDYVRTATYTSGINGLNTRITSVETDAKNYADGIGTSANSYTDGQIKLTSDSILQRVSSVETSTKSYADDIETSTKSYADSQIKLTSDSILQRVSSVETDAKSYADTQIKLTSDTISQRITTVEGNAKDYTDTQIKLTTDGINQTISTGSGGTITNLNNLASTVKGNEAIISSPDSLLRQVQTSSLWSSEIKKVSDESISKELKQTTETETVLYEYPKKLSLGMDGTHQEISRFTREFSIFYSPHLTSGSYVLELEYETDPARGHLQLQVRTEGQQIIGGEGRTWQYSNKTTIHFTVPSDHTGGVRLIIKVTHRDVSSYDVIVGWGRFTKVKLNKYQTVTMPVNNNETGLIQSQINQLNDSISLALTGSTGKLSSLELGAEGVKIKGDIIQLDGKTVMTDAFATNLFAENITADSVSAFLGAFSRIIAVDGDFKNISAQSGRFIQALFKAWDSVVKIDGYGLVIDSEKSWDMSLNNAGIQILTQNGNEIGIFQALTNVRTGEPHSVGVYAKNGYRADLGYFSHVTSEGTRVYRPSISVDGSTGDAIIQRDVKPDIDSKYKIKLREYNAGRAGIGVGWGSSSNTAGFYVAGNTAIISTGGYYYNMTEMLSKLHRL